MHPLPIATDLDRIAATVAGLGTILGVWAHPDDEAYLSAGLMALATSNGQRVVVVHATLGEHGTSDPKSFPPDRLRDVRARELAESLGRIGVHEHHQLGHPDGGCEAADHETGVAQVLERIQRTAPDTIVTFGPDGMTGHSDHQAVSRWTTEAWIRSGSRPRLLYAAVTTDWEARHRSLNERLGAFPPGFPRAVDPRHTVVELDLPAAVLDRKIAALEAHASQTLPLIGVAGRTPYRRWWSTEAFVAAQG